MEALLSVECILDWRCRPESNWSKLFCRQSRNLSDTAPYRLTVRPVMIGNKKTTYELFNNN